MTWSFFCACREVGAVSTAVSERQQALVQAADISSRPGDASVLVNCVVAPGFDFADFRQYLPAAAYAARINRGRNTRRAFRRIGRSACSSARKRRLEPHGHGSRPPSFSTSSVSILTTRSPRFTCVSLEGTPGGACLSAQKDVSGSRLRIMTTSQVSRHTGLPVTIEEHLCRPPANSSRLSGKRQQV
jgi:hypothetical protein